MYIGFDPTPTWTSERPSRNYDPGLNRNQMVMRAGAVQATYPLRSRAPAVLDEMFHVINRRGIVTQGRAPARNDSGAVRQAYDNLLARQHSDGSLGMSPMAAKAVIRQVKERGRATVDVLRADGMLGRLTITPDDIRDAPTDRLAEMRKISAQQAQGGYSQHAPISTRTRASGYGWRR